MTISSSVGDAVAGVSQQHRPSISVCISSYRRPVLLRQTLEALAVQDTGLTFAYTVVVCDNDPDQSARAVVTDLSARFETPIVYCTEPQVGIAHARNAALLHVASDYIAFVDDDEIPQADWLKRLFSTLAEYPVAGVLGPVRPKFESTPPKWLVKAGLCDRPEHHTGFRMPWRECRTGNLLFRREILKGIEPIFRPEFVTGSDANFFLRLSSVGHEFVWCQDAVVDEIVPPARWTRRFFIKRALLRGAQRAKQPRGKLYAVVKAMAAIPCYSLSLPILQMSGHHRFMTYLIKTCDHVGTLLGVIGIQVACERE